jgi:flagellar protein FlgJ
MNIAGVGTDFLQNKIKAGQTKADGDFSAGLAGAAQSSDNSKLKTVCRDMEAVFLNILMQKMRDTVPKSGLTGDTSGEDVMRSMLDTEMTKEMAKAGGIGLADMMYRQLTLSNYAGIKGQTLK